MTDERSRKDLPGQVELSTRNSS